MRQFEIPYNFDKKLIDGLKLLNIDSNMIACFYIPPYWHDYISVDRDCSEQLSQMSWEEYVSHINYIQENFPNKLQLLLQNITGKQILNIEQLQPYIDLGFNNFCCGTYEQAKIIKDINPTFTVVGSIRMHISKEILEKNKEKYKNIFDYFVLDFKYYRNIKAIKNLPLDFKYIILVNSWCNVNCSGDLHWDALPSKNFSCLYWNTPRSWETSCTIRPMDLKYFDPYIAIYKLQDRAWSSDKILKDVIIYMNDYMAYMYSEYNENIYQIYNEQGEPINDYYSVWQY